MHILFLTQVEAEHAVEHAAHAAAVEVKHVAHLIRTKSQGLTGGGDKGPDKAPPSPPKANATADPPKAD